MCDERVASRWLVLNYRFFPSRALSGSKVLPRIFPRRLLAPITVIVFRMPAILVVEDNRSDVVLLKHAFDAAGVLWDCEVVTDGQYAMDYLSEAMQAGTLPRYVLLDLKTPRRDGLDVLAWMRLFDSLRDVRVIVLTSSSLDEDRSTAERFGIDAYVIKPSNITEYKKTVRRIAELWRLPAAQPVQSTTQN